LATASYLVDIFMQLDISFFWTNNYWCSFLQVNWCLILTSTWLPCY